MADVTQQSPRSGRLIGEDGSTRNIVDLLGGGRAIGEKVVDIEQYAPRSGRVIGEDGKTYNEVDLLMGITGTINDIKGIVNDIGLSVQNGQLCQTYNV